MISYSRRGPNTSGIQLAELFYPGDTAKIRLARQVGITHAFYSVPTVLARVPRSEYVRELKRVQADLESADLIFAGVESHPVPAEKIKLGLPGRDEEIENYFAAIRALAEIGVHLICYNWMAGLSWYRTRVDLPGRGNALLSEFDYQAAESQGATEWGTVTEEKLWSNLEYFLSAVIPIAEANNVKLALHPDDPPVSPLRGIGRILTSADSFRRVLNFRRSPVNGITFCQANFSLMEENIAALAEEWCKEKKIFFVHFRDVKGTRKHFIETFHDSGPNDLAEMLRVYHACGFEGPIRPDHAPALHGEANDRPGYSIGGKILAVGYMKGVMDAARIPYYRKE